MINTAMDATNRVDQDIAAPMVFSVDEFTDCADQKHTFPITSQSSAFGGINPDLAPSPDVDSPIDKDRLKG